MEKEVIENVDIKTTQTKQLSVSKKICLNLYSVDDKEKQTQRRLRKISPFGRLMLKISFLRGVIN